MNDLARAAGRLANALRPLEFGPPVACVYRTLDYTWEAHRTYIERFGQGSKRVVFLGMNPGPYGMAQTGVPFGEVTAVRDWLKIETEIGRPATEHPKRQITGFNCTRTEISGKRLWGLFAARFGTPDAFFKDHFVLNFCPLIWMSETGANLTPDKISRAEMIPVESACLDHLATTLDILQPTWVVGIGGYAAERLKIAVKNSSRPIRVGRILHPSPASPAANRGWAEIATRELTELEIW